MPGQYAVHHRFTPPPRTRNPPRPAQQGGSGRPTPDRRSPAMTFLTELAALVAVASDATGVPYPAGGDHGPQAPERYTIGLFGDMPYNALGRQQYPALLADVN